MKESIINITKTLSIQVTDDYLKNLKSQCVSDIPQTSHKSTDTRCIHMLTRNRKNKGCANLTRKKNEKKMESLSLGMELKMDIHVQ